MQDSASRFGYFVSPDRQIDFDRNNHEVASKVAAAEPGLNWCISCGTCAATCTAAKFTDFSLRRIILQVKRGELKGLAREAQKCMLCGKCQLVCPRGISTRNLILQINRVLQSENL